ncbi:Rpn family recombination-promoting nuclease/putative transposase [Leptospira sp. 'Mane']|uniref:Rpn family recombination-promoting nuclease/putative transposase n=1 Tax=Leptospira sp. 'Mane' TaxID=3387407 RepID=UPI00398ABE5B
MQVGHQSVFVKRSIFYLAGLIRDQLSSSDPYSNLKPVYQINFLDFNLIPSQNFINRFKFREDQNRELTLTDDLEIVFIELPKFKESSGGISSSLEAWTFFIKNAHSLLEVDMDIVVDKLPDLKSAYLALELYSSDPIERKRLEDKMNSDRDFAYEVAYNFERGLKEGELRGKMEGEIKAKVTTAKSLLANGVDIDVVIKATGLSLEELKSHGVV